MATTPGTKVGNMACPEHPTVQMLMRENAHGTLSGRCEECDDTHYAKKGTGKFTAWLAKMKKFPGAAAAPAEEKKEEKGAPAKKSGVFPAL